MTRLHRVRDWRAWAIVVTGAIGAFLYSNFILDYILPGSDSVFEVISELETAGNPNADVLRTTDVIGGILMLVPLPYVWAAMPKDASSARRWSCRRPSSRSAVPSRASSRCPAVDRRRAATAAVSRSSGGSMTVPARCRRPACSLARWQSPSGSGTSARAGSNSGAGSPSGSAVCSVPCCSAGRRPIDSDSWQTGASQRFQVLMSSVWVVCYSIYAAKDGLAAVDRSRHKGSTV